MDNLVDVSHWTERDSYSLWMLNNSMKSNASLTKKDVDHLLNLMKDDEELREKMVEVLRAELLGTRARMTNHSQDIGRLRR